MKLIKISQYISSGLYSGYFPFASGTFASAISLFLFIAVYPYTHISPKKFAIYLTLLTTIIGLITVYFSLNLTTQQEDIAKTNKNKKQFLDPKWIVIDEWAGMFLALTGVNFINNNLMLQYFSAFVLFRLFDIIKTTPMKELEALPLPWGIMLDDLAAGALAAIILILIQ